MIITNQENVAALKDILQELERAKTLHPVWPDDIVHAVAKVTEEAGEALQAANDIIEGKGDIEKVETELIHTGAMSIRALVNLRERYGRRKENRYSL